MAVVTFNVNCELSVPAIIHELDINRVFWDVVCIQERGAGPKEIDFDNGHQFSEVSGPNRMCIAVANHLNEKSNILAKCYRSIKLTYTWQMSGRVCLRRHSFNSLPFNPLPLLVLPPTITPTTGVI